MIDIHQPSRSTATHLATWAMVGFLSMVARTDGQGVAVDEAATQGPLVFDFGSDGDAWTSIDDRVMGGVSRSRMMVQDGVARFTGTLSFEQNGGFTSVRSAPTAHALAGYAGLTLRVRGDGRTYDLRLRTGESFDGVSYRVRFGTWDDGAWKVVRVPFADFEPVFRGRRVPRYPALDPGAVRTFGILLADGPAGDFWIEIDWIRAFSARTAT